MKLSKILFFEVLAFITLNCYAQNGPTGLNGYEINKTTLSDILSYADKSVNKLSSYFDVIKDDDELTEVLVLDYDSTEAYSTKIYELNYTDSTPRANTIFYTITDSVRVFFINQMSLGDSPDYLVNNIFLTFYRDTLVNMDFSIPRKTIDLYLIKYKGQFKKHETRNLPSDCQSKFIKKKIYNNWIDYTSYNTIRKVSSKISWVIGLNSDCEIQNFAKISIVDIKKQTIVMNKSIALLKRMVKEIKNKKEQSKTKALEGL